LSLRLNFSFHLYLKCKCTLRTNTMTPSCRFKMKTQKAILTLKHPSKRVSRIFKRQTSCIRMTFGQLCWSKLKKSNHISKIWIKTKVKIQSILPRSRKVKRLYQLRLKVNTRRKEFSRNSERFHSLGSARIQLIKELQILTPESIRQVRLMTVQPHVQALFKVGACDSR